ncbi:MAG: putative toxin-antitoxin system toxin component, PIN family [Burkholderiales bacterium]|nr:putative toxin-antitoxin system toxin component, PIN family [Burkholderiales bacterium]MCW5604827.1 putative toxin-antitoxin system toxin component, PIN family [Burkholderiales bacterium]
MVLDTNVWLDWLVFGDPGVLPLKLAVKTGAAVVLIDSACLDELTRVLAYPLRKPPLDEAQRSACIAACRACSQLVEARPAPPLPKCADPDDQKFLELAAGSRAGCLLSKDRALLAMGRSRTLPFHIMTPAEFSARGGVESFRRHG